MHINDVITKLFAAFTDLIPVRYRQQVHAVLTLLFAGIALWLAVEGDALALLALLATAYTASNASNTHESPADDTLFVGFEENDEHDDGLGEVTYEEAGE